MTYRDSEEALRARIEELERELAAFRGQEHDRPIATLRAQVAKLTAELKKVKRNLSHALDARDQAIEQRDRALGPKEPAAWPGIGVWMGFLFAGAAAGILFSELLSRLL